jgi:hypothetical protein
MLPWNFLFSTAREDSTLLESDGVQPVPPGKFFLSGRQKPSPKKQKNPFEKNT